MQYTYLGCVFQKKNDVWLVKMYKKNPQNLIEFKFNFYVLDFTFC